MTSQIIEICKECEHRNNFPNIYWSKIKCSNFKFNSDSCALECANFKPKEVYLEYRFSFTLECTAKGSLICRKNLANYLKENYYAFNNIQSEKIIK